MLEGWKAGLINYILIRCVAGFFYGSQLVTAGTEKEALVLLNCILPSLRTIYKIMREPTGTVSIGREKISAVSVCGIFFEIPRYRYRTGSF